MSKKKTVSCNPRREAALKAWRTRRANDLTKKRHEAALKAWRTRWMDAGLL